MTRTLVTGAAGFIGFHVARVLLEKGDSVVGVDDLNPYYNVRLKKDRLAALEPYSNFSFQSLDVGDPAPVRRLFEEGRFDRVVHLAAQAGVRYSVENPHAYIHSNLVAFANLIEACRRFGIKHLVFASSSSVYGANTHMPFSVHDNVDHPVSLYAATKKSNELIAHSYAHLFGLPCTGLRFFTVYGPWGRPDMAPMLFASAIAEGRPIQVFNNGNMKRDFTYVDDIARGVSSVLDKIPEPNPQWSGDHPDPSSSRAPYRIYNIGNHHPVSLMRFIELVEECMGRQAEKILMPLQPGDVVETYADISELVADTGFSPTTAIEDGVPLFIEWFKAYYGV